jgi:hypothetical protein
MNNINQDFRNELENTNNQVETLEPPIKHNEEKNAYNDISTQALFSHSMIEGKTPELTQDFVLLKSKQDKLVEMGQIAQEVFQTKLVCRRQIIAIESIGRELTSEIENEERKVIVSDHEVNMFTEEPSQVEVDTVIDNSQTSIDRISGDLRTSAIALAEKLISTVEKDREERKEKLYKSISVFNQASIKFLEETNNSGFEEVDLKFKRNLRWGDLMSIPLSRVSYTGEEAEQYEKMISSFDGTSAETFIKDLGTFFQTSHSSFDVIRNFILGTATVITNSSEASNVIAEVQEKQVGCNTSLTIGTMFKSFGDYRFAGFYNRLENIIEEQLTAIRNTKELFNGKTDITQLLELTAQLHNQQKTILDCTANMAVLNHVQYLIIKFLSTF